MKAYTESGMQVVLNDHAELNRGGEGRIILLQELPGMVAKIYFNKQQAITPQQLKALSVLNESVFVKPRALLFDKPGGNVLGFTMPLLPAGFEPLNALFSEPYCRKNGITYTRKLHIASQIAQAVAHAHNHGLIIGDLSALNILVNPQDEVKFIDVDSYETPVKPHSGTLLNEIRDYYFGGGVSRQSDYFALAVLIFQLLTYVHPYKGTHPQFNTLKDRMIQQLPLFAPDKQLVLPKCYQPVTDNALQKQFEAIFMYAARTPLQLHNLAQVTRQSAPVQTFQPVLMPKSALQIQTILQPAGNEFIEDLFCLSNRLLVTTNTRFVLYDMSRKGVAVLQAAYPRHIARRLFAGHNNIVAEKNNLLYLLLPDGNLQPVHNITLQAGYRFMQYNNLLAVVEDSLLKTIWLDNTNGNCLQSMQTPVFGPGITVANGAMWQNTGGKLFVFYPSGQFLSAAGCNFALHNLYMQQNIGIMLWKSGNANGETALQTAYFGIHNLQVRPLSNLPHHNGLVKKFALRQTDNHQGIIFEPADNQLLIRRTEDGAVLQQTDCTCLTDHDELHLTNAGLVCLTASGQLYLLNLNA